VKYFILILCLCAGCAEVDEGSQVQLRYTTPRDCQVDLYPDFAPDEYYDKVDDLCGGENRFEGPEPF